MTNYVPLIPDKKATCNDVRPLLREVFRDLHPEPVLAEQLQCEQNLKDNKVVDVQIDQWIQQHELESEEMKNREEQLQHEYAKRLALESPTDKLFSEAAGCDSEWKKQLGIIRIKDVKPSLEKYHDRKGLCAKKTSIKSLCNLNSTMTQSMHHRDISRSPKDFTIQSVSMAHSASQLPASSPQQLTSASSPHYIVCVPPQLNFVNFTVGQDHVKRLRLVNISKYEVRLAFQPPSRSELQVELLGNRGTTVTSGSTLKLRVHFKPRDVRSVNDELFVRVSLGSAVSVPITCYMQPPLLDVVVPRVRTLFSARDPATVTHSTEVLDLGARLLGDVHRVPLQLYCNVDHACFYVMSEEAWCSFTVDEVATRTGVVVVGAFSIRPTLWRGAGGGEAACRAPSAGLRTAALRILSSTAIVRPLHLVADAIMFSPEHVALQTPEKTYDIFIDGDPSCPYYVHLGTAFPNQPLSATVQLINHSSVSYSYLWSVRAWDETLSRVRTIEKSDRFSEHVDELEACFNLENQQRSVDTEAANAIRVEPLRGIVAPRSSIAVHVCAPKAGERCGMRRAVLMLVLTNVPRESLSPEYEHMIISTETIEEDELPGLSRAWTRTVCQVLCTQMEVWWDVVPVRFVIHPPVVNLTYSKGRAHLPDLSLATSLQKYLRVNVLVGAAHGSARRSSSGDASTAPHPSCTGQVRTVKSIEVPVHVTQLYGTCGVRVKWTSSGTAQGRTLVLRPAHTVTTSIRVPLSTKRNEETQLYQLESENGDWQASCVVKCVSGCSRVTMRPRLWWRGTLPPGETFSAQLQLQNNTHAPIEWRATMFAWVPSVEKPRCASSSACEQCGDRECVCTALAPARGSLPPGREQAIVVTARSPAQEGCSVSVVQVQCSGRGAQCCSAVLANRALAPRLMLRVAPYMGDDLSNDEYEKSELDEGDVKSATGVAVLRPRVPLTAGRSTRYELRCTNITPVATVLRWEAPAGCEEVLEVLFIPEHCEVNAYATVTIQVVVCARAACVRRVCVCRAHVLHARTHAHLVLDAAVDGRKVSIDVPLDDCEDLFATIVRSECNVLPLDTKNKKSLTPEDIFIENDQKKIKHRDAERPISSTCPCFADATPMLLEQNEPICLQFKNVPLNTAQVVYAAGEAGVSVQCEAARGALVPGGRACVNISVRGDCWGLYTDQLLIQMENLEPVILDVWIEVVGAPLLFAIKPTGESDDPPVLWMSTSDSERLVHVTNTSCAGLSVYSYVLKEHEHPQDALPLRLYLRFFDVSPQELVYNDGYVVDFNEDGTLSQVSLAEEPSTGIELFLSEDYGTQADTIFKVHPSDFTIAAGTRASQTVRVLAGASLQSKATLLLQMQPMQRSGPGWFRPDPPAQRLRLHVEGRARLQLSRCELLVLLSALHLPPSGVTRVRKYFHALNVGDGPLTVDLLTESPWSVFLPNRNPVQCVRHCKAATYRTKSEQMVLELPKHSSTEVCAEVTVHTDNVWPATGDEYSSPYYTTTPLNFFQDQVLLLCIPLSVEIELPTLSVQPAHIDFGSVVLGDSRKTYFTVSHTSSLTAMEAVVRYHGDEEFTVWPKNLCMSAGCTGRVYVQYTARRRDTAAEGTLYVFAAGPEGSAGVIGIPATEAVETEVVEEAVGSMNFAGVARSAGRWCSARVSLHAVSTTDRAHALQPHDYTDDPHLLNFIVI